MSYEVFSGQVSNGIAALGWKSMFVYDGGLANNTTVAGSMSDRYFFGSLCVYSGGVANNTTLNGGGRMYVSGGEVNLTTVNGSGAQGNGSMFVSSGGVANSTTVNSGGEIMIYDGGIANATYVKRSARMWISSGGVANSVNLSGLYATLYISSGGTASDIVMYGDTYNSNGNLYVSKGGVVNNATVNRYGNMFIYNGGTATAIRENGGYVGVYGNATFVSNSFSGLVLSLGSATLHSGTTAISTTLKRGALYIYNGGMADNTIVDSGYLYINGGLAQSTIVSNAGSVYVSNGGKINEITVDSGGHLYISNGGKLTGGLTIVNGAVVSAFNGSIIDFDISNVAPGGAARINNLSLVSGTPDYVITVSAMQTMGVYALADGAAGFDKTVTVVTESGEEVGTVTVGNALVGLNGCDKYTLLLTNGRLSFEAGRFEAVSSALPVNINGEIVNTSDYAARWTSDTVAEDDTINIVSQDFGGDAWLDIDGANLSGSDIFGTAGEFAGHVNLTAESGNLHNLAAGAGSGGTVGGVNLKLVGATVSGAAYAGGFGNVTDKIETVISGTAVMKDFYAGALANYAKTDMVTNTGDIFLKILGGAFDGNIFGAAAVKAGSGGVTAHRTGAVSLTLFGGSSTKADGEFCLFAGGYATGRDSGGTERVNVYEVGDITVDISGGDWGTVNNGRGIFGGIFTGDNISDTEHGETACGVRAEAGDVNISISGGSMGNVYGGGWAQRNGTSIVGNVDITVSGGTVANIFGGGSTSTSGGATITGDVTITVENGSITGAIYAMGQGATDSVGGNVAVTFRGTNDYVCGVYGYSYVGGAASEATLSFTGYTGNFSGRIGGFAGITFGGDTAMELGTAAAHVSNYVWNFDVSARDADLSDTAILDWNAANFAGDTIALNLASGSTAAWTLVDAAAITAYGEFDVLIEGVSQGTLELGEKLASGEFAGWGFTVEDTVLKFKQLA